MPAEPSRQCRKIPNKPEARPQRLEQNFVPQTHRPIRTEIEEEDDDEDDDDSDVETETATIFHWRPPTVP
jgi:hypothetical protein